MKRKRHSLQQVIRKLGEAKAALVSGQPLSAVCQMLGVSEQTYYRWKKQYGNVDFVFQLTPISKSNTL